MEFCQWLMNEKGIEAGNLSDYINNNEEEVLKLAEEFKNPKFKIGGKIESAAEMFKCGGKTKKVEKKQEGGETPNHTIYDLKTGKVSKKVDGIGNKETYVDGPIRRTLEVFNGDSTIVAKDPNWPESRSRSYEDIITFMRKKDIGFDTNLRSFNGMKEMFQKKYPSVKSMAGGGEAKDPKTTANKTLYPAHKKWGITPWEFSYMVAPRYDLPMRDGITVPRYLKKVSGPSGVTKEYVVKSDTGERTIRITDRNGNRYYTFNGIDYYPVSEMYDRYESVFKEYGLKKGGVIKGRDGEKLENKDRKKEYKNANPINYIEGHLTDGRRFTKSSNYTAVYDDDIDEITFRVRENGDSVFGVYPVLRDYDKHFLVFQDNGKWNTSVKFAEPTHISNLPFKELINRLREAVKNIPDFNDAEKIK